MADAGQNAGDKSNWSVTYNSFQAGANASQTFNVDGTPQNQHGSSRGRGTFRGRRGTGAGMGRGASGAPSTRGKPSFSNRSAVFSAPKEKHEEDAYSEVEDGSQQAQQMNEQTNHNDEEAVMDDEEIATREREKRFENLPKQNRFFELRAQREALRTQYIRQGILPDPDKPTDLAKAKEFTGACMEMCPEFEREEREFQNEGDVLEMFPGTSRIDPELAVKIYRRPAAGRELPLPEDVRPPVVLRRTLDYLVHTLLPSDPSSSSFTAVQPFMWNRTRAIRQDFIVQGERGSLAIECHERIARYHILCLHWRGGKGAEGWSEQQELEQLRKTIRSLTEFYEDMRLAGQSSPNEGEFRAYNLLLHIHDPETLREVEALPSQIFDSEAVQSALKLRAYAQRSNNVVRRGRPRNTEATMNLWTRFFGELRRKSGQVTYLLACLAENSFSPVRAGALKAMSKTYLSQHAPLPLSFLRNSLGLDSEEEARSFAVELGAEEAFAADGQLLGVRLGKVDDAKPLPVAPFSQSIVEAKRGSFTLQDVIDGVASEAAHLEKIASRPTSKSTAPPPSIMNKESKVQIAPAKTATKSDALLPAPTTSKSSSLSASATAFVPAAFSADRKQDLFVQGQSATPPVDAAPLEVSSFTPPASFKAASAFGSNAFSQPKVSLKVQSPPLKAPATIASLPHSNVSISNSFDFKQPTQVDNKAADSQVREFSFLSAAGEKADQGSPATPFSLPPGMGKAQSDISPFSTSTPPRPSAEPVPVPSVVGEATTSLRTESQIKTEAAPQPPKRTVSSVVNALYKHLCRNLIERKVQSMSEQACLREQRIRRSRSRKETIARIVDELQHMMLEEALDENLAACASASIAKIYDDRKTKSVCVQKWKKAVSRARERTHQTERLHQVRAKLEARRPGRGVGTNAETLHEESMALTRAQAHDDEALYQSIVHAQEDRLDIWMPSTFLWALAADTQYGVLVAGIDGWTVALSLNGQAASSRWLRTKFSVDKEPHAEVTVRSDASVHVVDTGSCSTEDLEEERNLGLLVYELDPELDDLSADVKVWQQDKMRLETIVRRSFVHQSRFLPKLLIITWTSGDGAQQKSIANDVLRKNIFKQLGLTVTDPLRYFFSQIDIWTAGRSHNAPQQSFELRLKSLMKAPLEWNKARQMITFDDILAACGVHWRSMVERVNGCMIRLTQAWDQHRWTSDSPAARDSFALLSSTFETVTFLCHRVIDDLVAVSEFVQDENTNGIINGLPSIVPDAASASSSSLSSPSRTNAPLVEATFDLAEAQVHSMLVSDSSPSVLLLRSWLVEHRIETEMRRFSWTEYFDRVLSIAVTQCQRLWIEATLSSVEEIEAQVRPSTDLHAQAAREVEWKTRLVLREVVLQPLPASLTNVGRKTTKRRELSEGEEEEAFRDNGLPTSLPLSKVRKVTRTFDEDVQMVEKPSQADEKPVYRSSASNASSAVSSLRSLIASANALLSEKQAVEGDRC